MRFGIQIVAKDRTRRGIPAMVEADNIDAAIVEFIKRDAGRWLQRGCMIEVTDENSKKLNFLYSDDGPKWIPTF